MLLFLAVPYFPSTHAKVSRFVGIVTFSQKRMPCFRGVVVTQPARPSSNAATMVRGHREKK